MYLKKCHGACLKGKDVSKTNCIGINHGHFDCQYSIHHFFNHGFCPYYIPLANEKNYTQEWQDIAGQWYYRRPFRVIWFYFLFIVLLISIYIILNLSFKISYWFILFKMLIPYITFITILVFLGNKLLYKNKHPIAVINSDGIYTPRLLIKWEDIIKIKSSYYFLSGRTYLVSLEIKIQTNPIDEKIYIYFSTLEMRLAIKKQLHKFKKD